MLQRLMNKYELFQLVQGHILRSPGFRTVPFFPNNIQTLSNVEQLIWWLAITDFSASQMGVAIHHLILTVSILDASGEKLLKLLHWVVNQDKTGLLGITIEIVELSLRDKEKEQARQSITQAVESLVRQQPGSRSYIAEWIIYEFNLGYHPDLPLVEFAEEVKQNYQREFGRPLSIDMYMTIGLATRDLDERTRLNKVVVMALNHMFPNISSLAIVWLAEARAESSSLQRTLQKIQRLTLKQIWNGAQFRTFTTNPRKVLLAGDTFKDSFGDTQPTDE